LTTAAMVAAVGINMVVASCPDEVMYRSGG
jgi:hypothetical protein